ncbi:MAG: hypothetical protein Q9226_008873 [Calogaya cf. arnoldii]
MKSGPKLTTLLIYNTVRQSEREDYTPRISNDDIVNQYLQVKNSLGFTHTDLLRLNSLCPNLEHLGFDVKGSEIRELHHKLHDALTTFHKLRHLELWIRAPARLFPRPPASDYWELKQPREDGDYSLVSGPSLVEFFQNLLGHPGNSKRVPRLQTLTIHNQGHENCTLHKMGEQPQRTLITYRSPGATVLTKELYEGSKLLWTRHKHILGNINELKEEFPEW